MDQYELQEFIQFLSKESFNKPFNHQAFFNSRLRTTGGRYHLDSHHLDFNPKILEKFGREIFEGVIKHELCHYHLHLEGKGYRHADADFKNLLKEVDGLRYTPSIEAAQESILRWAYRCQNCTTKIYRKRRFNEKKYVCAHCSGYFELEGRKEIFN